MRQDGIEPHRYLAGYRECMSCRDLEVAMNKQAATDEQVSKNQKTPVPTRQRQWFTEPYTPTE